MHEKSNTNVKIFGNRATVFYQFLVYGDVILIGKASWRCQECNGIVLWLGKVLYVRFQFSKF